MTGMTSAAMVKKWAEFSGDFNPIHFDVDMARQAGADGLIVHGMLALLEVKQEVANAARHLYPKDSWQHFKAMFRTPILQGAPADIALSEKRGAIAFTLKSGAGECFRGTHALAEAPVESFGDPVQFELGARMVEERYRQFRAAFPSIDDAWIFVDALVFSEFLRDKFERLARTPKKLIAVQISHRVLCNLDAVNALFCQYAPCPALGFSVKGTQSNAQPGSEFGVAELDVVADGHPVMRIEIGLLAREVESPDTGITTH